jgi:DNA-directed RNA polymerase subunit RPC12/RpoP
MKCPHCKSKISLVSKAMNCFGAQKKCPHCSKKSELFVNYKIAAILFVPTVALSIFIINPLVADLGFVGSLISGGVFGLIISFSMQLRSMD